MSLSITYNFMLCEKYRTGIFYNFHELPASLVLQQQKTDDEDECNVRSAHRFFPSFCVSMLPVRCCCDNRYLCQKVFSSRSLPKLMISSAMWNVNCEFRFYDGHKWSCKSTKEENTYNVISISPQISPLFLVKSRKNFTFQRIFRLFLEMRLGGISWISTFSGLKWLFANGEL